MALEITEAEMIERLIDGLKRSASRAQEITVAEEKKKPGILVDFIDAIKVSAGSSHQLAHAQENPKWLDIRDLLEGIVTLGMALPLMDANSVWLEIKTSLENLSESCRKIATMQAMKRVDVLMHLNERAHGLDS